MYWIAYAEIVAGLLIYQAAQKTVPKGTNPFWYVSIAYAVGLAACLAMAFLLPREEPGPIVRFNRPLVISAVALGVGATLIEVGYFFGYRAGWALSELPLAVTIATCACLAVAGALFFNESLTPTRLVGMALCGAGLFLVLRKEAGV